MAAHRDGFLVWPTVSTWLPRKAWRNEPSRTVKRLLGPSSVRCTILSQSKGSLKNYGSSTILISHTALVRDVETRWNSTLNMVQSILRYREAVEALANHRIMRTVADFQRPRMFMHWSEVLDLVSGLIEVLKPAEEATLMVSSNDACMASYVPMIKGLEMQLAFLKDSLERGRQVLSVIEEMEKQWKERMSPIVNPSAVMDN